MGKRYSMLCFRFNLCIYDMWHSFQNLVREIEVACQKDPTIKEILRTTPPQLTPNTHVVGKCFLPDLRKKLCYCLSFSRQIMRGALLIYDVFEIINFVRKGLKEWMGGWCYKKLEALGECIPPPRWIIKVMIIIIIIPFVKQ